MRARHSVLITSRTAVTAIAAITATLPPLNVHADQVRADQWHIRSLNVAEAHALSRGVGVTVAVIDTGVAPHPDLQQNLLIGTDVVPGGSGTGQQDTDSHGTAMAGLIAAHGRGADGALGIAPQAKVLPVRVETELVSGDMDAVASGIEWAAAHGARVISISQSGGSTHRLRSAVASATAADIVIVASAGNQPANVVVGFPASLSGVVAVGAVDRQQQILDISVRGDKITIAAPGVDIYSTSTNGKYRRGTGTSDATAIVAGAAALVRSRYPRLSAPEVIHRLTATATDRGAPGRDPEYGFGVLNIVAALTADVPPLAGSPPTGTAAPTVPTAAAGDRTGQPAPAGGLDAAWFLTAVGIASAGGLVLLFVLRRRRLADERRTTGRSEPPPGGPDTS